eukprot:c23150_g1_i1 orf=382-807(+)
MDLAPVQSGMIVLLCLVVMFFVCPIKGELASSGMIAKRILRQDFQGRRSIPLQAQRQSFYKLSNSTELKLFPVTKKQYHQIEYDDRRILVPFQLCSLCKCCDNTRVTCMYTACCFDIVCDEPSQPFGVCSLNATACNCFNC